MGGKHTFCFNTGWHAAPYSMFALRVRAGSRVLVSDVPAVFALKLQENSTTSCGCKHSCDVDRTISVSKGQITLYSLNRQVIKGSKP